MDDLDSLPRKKGSIVRIKLENFMTFAHCEFKPGPRLNLILGPNGSGKSSLVCAIGLGLGGTPKLMGRSAHVKDFIKKGENESRIEIELFGEQNRPNVIIERKLEVGGSKWRLDNKLVTEQRIQEVLKNFNIQVDNLVQFLPQDRVAEFAQFDEMQLLRETIRAVNGAEQLELQKTLATRQKEVGQQVAKLDRKQEELDTLTAENARNEHAVNRQRDRANLLREIELARQKLPWIQFEEARDAVLAFKEEVTRLDQLHKEGSKILEPLKASSKEVIRASEKSKKSVDKAQQEYKAWSKDIGELQEEMTKLFENIVEEKTTLDTIEERKAKALKLVEDKRKKVETLSKECAARKGDVYYQKNLAEIDKEYLPLVQQERSLSKDLSVKSSLLTRTQSQLEGLVKKMGTVDVLTGGPSLQRQKEIELGKVKLIDKLPYMSQPLKQELRKMRETMQQVGFFKSKVVGPLICDLRAGDEEVGKVLEYGLKAPHWKFMVAKNVDDYKKLMTLRIPSVLVPSDERRVIPRALNRAQMTELGVRDYLDVLLLGDSDAIEAAKILSNIGHVMVGTAATDKLYSTDTRKFDRLIQLPMDFTDKIIIITPTSRFEVSRSRYGEKDQTVRRTVLDPRKLLGLPLDKSHEEAQNQAALVEKRKADALAAVKQKQECEARLVTLAEEVKTMEDGYLLAKQRVEELKKEKDEQQNAFKNERSLGAKLAKAEEDLETARVEASQNWEKKILDSTRKLAKLRIEAAELASTVVDKSAESTRILASLASSQLSKSQLEAEKDVLTTLTAQEEQRLSGAAEELKRAKDKYEKMRKRAHELKLAAEKACTVTDELATLFAPLPDTVEELEQFIETKTCAVNHIFEDPAALQQYEKRLEEIKKLEQFLGENGPQVDASREALKVEVDNWKSGVSGMAESINSRVKMFFAEISKAGYACAGEVALVTPNLEDVSTYGMQIQVKFRQEQKMSKLDPSVQSGGERSLTTFLYMLALQDLSTVPFRVVDEINQGMDADKERLAFYRLADVSNKSQAQYFLATPKLLPGLAYPKTATILFVFNGPYNLHQGQWNINRFVTANKHKRLSLGSTDASSSSPESVAETKSSKRVRASVVVDEQEEE